MVDHAVTTTTPADLSDLSAVDLLHFPADWNIELTDVDVDTDFAPLTDIRPPAPATDHALPFLPMATDQTSFQLPSMSELFPVYDDVISAWVVGDDAPMFDGFNDLLWNTSNFGQVISVQ